MIGGEQAVERRAGTPAARRATGSPVRCARSSARSGPNANGISVTTDEEEQHADQRAAADARGDADVAHEQGGRARSCRALQLKFSRAVEPQRQMRRRDDRCRRPRDARASIRRSTLLRGGIERRGRLVEQPEGTLHGDQARRSNDAAFARPRDRPAGRSAASMAEADGGERTVRGVAVAAEPSTIQNDESSSRTVSAGLRASLMAEIMGLLADSCAPGRRPLSDRCRRRSAADPRSAAAATTCRRRCGPVTSQRLAACDRKSERLRKSSGRPGWQTFRPCAGSGHRSAPVPQVVRGAAIGAISSRRASCLQSFVHMADRSDRKDL